MGVPQIVVVLIRAIVADRAELAAEDLALRQQLAILEQRSKRPRLRRRDRIFWVWLSRLWGGWRSVLAIVQPETVLQWHQQGFRLYWRWKSRTGKVARPRIDAEIRSLIRRMSRENPLWGTPRIQSELRLLGYEASKATVDLCMVRHHKPPSQTWRAFLGNHVPDIVAVDFFTVPTATFRILFCFIVLNEAHVRRILTSYFASYHESRAHLSLECNAPVPPRVEHPSEGKVIAIPQSRRLASSLSPRGLSSPSCSLASVMRG